MWATSDGSISLCRSDAARCFSKNSLSAPASLTSGLVDIFRKNSTLPSERVGTALEIKSFDAHDGQGLTLARTAGVRTGITGTESAALLRRANEMKMELIYMKQPVKMPAYEEILQKMGVSDSYRRRSSGYSLNAPRWPRP
jgi:hypothetical protein